MKISQLQTFVAIVEAGSFSSGAKKQKVSQPAATFQIQALEESLQVKLIDRSSKALLLTEAGKLCYESGKRIVIEVSHLETQLKNLSSVVQGELSIGASTIPGEYILPLVLGEFKAAYPDIRPQLEVAGTESILERVSDGFYDIGVVGAKVENRKLEYAQFVADELIIIGNAHYTEDIKHRLHLADLISEPFILRESGSGTRLAFERILESHELTVKDINIAMELGSAEAVITAVQAGLGLSAVSRWAAENALRLDKVMEMNVDGFPIARDMYIVILKKRIMSGVAERFLQFLDQFKAHWKK